MLINKYVQKQKLIIINRHKKLIFVPHPILHI